MDTGALIVYTSADSVLQIAAHEDIVPLEELYRICEIARELTFNDKYLVGRVIARPFIGEPEAFERTANRHDYALKPFSRTVMNELKEANYDVIALGKIADIYANSGVTESIRTVDNADGMDQLIASMDKDFMGRSEEHTSELQSRGHLVCRLLLEKKKRQTRFITETRAGSEETRAGEGSAQAKSAPCGEVQRTDATQRSV